MESPQSTPSDPQPTTSKDLLGEQAYTDLSDALSEATVYGHHLVTRGDTEVHRSFKTALRYYWFLTPKEQKWLLEFSRAEPVKGYGKPVAPDL